MTETTRARLERLLRAKPEIAGYEFPNGFTLSISEPLAVGALVAFLDNAAPQWIHMRTADGWFKYAPSWRVNFGAPHKTRLDMLIEAAERVP